MVDVLNPREMTAEQFKDMSKGRDSPPPAAETRIEAVGMGFLHPEVEHGSTESRPSTSMGSCADPMGSLRRRPNALVPETPMHDAEGGLLNHQNVNAVDKMRKDAAHVLAVMEDVGPLSYRQSPWKLMRRDIAFFAGHFTTIPRLFGGAEGPSEPVTSAMGHLLMVFTSLVITVFCVVAFAVLSILIAVLYLFALSAHLFQGDLIRHSKASKTLRYAVRPDGTRDTDANNDYTEIQHREVEKWFL
jgi:hypothetical protein